MTTGLTGLVIYYNSRISTESLGFALIMFSLFIFSLEFLRLKNSYINDFAITLMRPFMRECERSSISGMPFYALGVGLSLVLFSEKIAVLSVLFLVFADPIASVFGILFGKDKILPNKSLQGSLAAFAVCYVLTMVYGMHYSNPNINLLCFSLLAGVIGSFSELCSTFLDDNLSIPVISGFLLTLVNVFWIPVF